MHVEARREGADVGRPGPFLIGPVVRVHPALDSRRRQGEGTAGVVVEREGRRLGTDLGEQFDGLIDVLPGVADEQCPSQPILDPDPAAKVTGSVPALG